MPKTPKKNQPSKPPPHPRVYSPQEITPEDFFHAYSVDAKDNDLQMLGTVLHDIGHLLAAHWDHAKEAANEAGEGEIIVRMEVVLPFGTSEPVVATKIGFTCKKITDQRETKLEDPNQTNLDLEHAGKA